MTCLAGAPDFLNSLTTSGRALTKPTQSGSQGFCGTATPVMSLPHESVMSSCQIGSPVCPNLIGYLWPDYA
jgi:hypothetical protein